jgi:transcriptional regulator with XRE-family HTH domain
MKQSELIIGGVVMDMLSVIRERMQELGLEQKDLAASAEVTESYISQLLTRKKAPPAPERTDIYSKLEKSLKLPVGRLSRLAELQRKEELKRKVVEPPAPLLKEVREMILRKCVPEKEGQIRAIFEKQPFGELERLVTQKLLDVVKSLAKEELGNESWLHRFARLSDRSYEEVRVSILEFLDTDVFHVSSENCVSFLDPMIESWDVDFTTFGIEIILNRRLVAGQSKRFEFVEQGVEPPFEMEPGLEDYLNDSSLSGDVTDKEIEFLKRLRFNGARPTPLYYYREVQSLRDPLHFINSQADSESRPKRGAKRRRRKRPGQKGS